MGTGDGDSAVDVEVALNQLFSTADGLGALEGFLARIDNSAAIYQAFSENGGTIPLGSPYTADTFASLSGTSSGGTESKPNDAISIGTFFYFSSADSLPEADRRDPFSTASLLLQLDTASDTVIGLIVSIDSLIFQVATTGIEVSVSIATKLFRQIFADAVTQ